MKSHPLFEKLRIFAPGPTPVPPEVLAAMALPPLHHRTEEFSAILERTRANLSLLYQTKQPVYMLAASGTGAMEAAVVNLLSQGDEVLVINGGKFGERWKKMAEHYSLKAETIDVEWGTAVSPALVEEALKKRPSIKAILFQASETSTGVQHPTKEIAKIVHDQSDALVIVDAITGLGVFDLPMDDWELDAVIGGSQKALMLPPGLAFLALSERAHQRKPQSNLPNFYFNLEAEDKAAKTGQTAWTPAVSLICGLDMILERMRAVGLPTLFGYYERIAEATRRGAQGMGLELFAPDSPSPAVTAIKVPSALSDGKQIVSHLRKRYGVTIAGGQDHLKGKIFRIGHLGFYDELDILTLLSAVELTLGHLGFPIEFGCGVGAAAKYLSQENAR